MRGTVKWSGGMSFEARSESGHGFRMDGPAEYGGQDSAPRPMEVVLIGAGGCTAFDVVLILKKGRHDVTGCEVELTAERAPTDPKVFTKIHFHFVVTGRDLKPEVVERAVSLSHEKYCSATAMLRHTAAITHDFEVREPAA